MVTRLTIALALFATTVGCSMEASLQRLNSQHPILQLPAKATGLVTGSSQKGETTDGAFLVQSTVGSYTSEIEQQTSDGSYVIFGSVQGALISE